MGGWLTATGKGSRAATAKYKLCYILVLRISIVYVPVKSVLKELLMGDGQQRRAG